MPEPKYANPLLVQWVEDWLEIEKQRNTRGVQTYKKALASLKKCPMTFEHPSQVTQLQNIGETISKKLTERMEEYCKENGLPMPKKGKKRIRLPDNDETEGSPSPPKKQKKAKPYVPALRSGPYAIILALATLDEDDDRGLSKAQTIELAEEHCSTSFTVPIHANKHYTAWSSMTTLTNKNLVYEKKSGALRKYLLTDEGWKVARGIQRTQNPTLNNHDGSDDDASGADESQRPRETESLREKDSVPEIISSSTTDALPEFTAIDIKPGTFTVQLVIDTREVRSKQDRDFIKNDLEKRGLSPIVRALGLGDFLWIAKLHDPAYLSRHGGEGDEVLLDWIIERKRLDDLIGSIKDGRFSEQKFRLRKSGVKNVVYMIEDHGIDSQQSENYAEALITARVSSQVVDKFNVKQTVSLDDSLRYITTMTNMLKEIYEKKELHVIPSSVLTTRNHMPLVLHLREKHPAKDFNITYSAFSALASKSDTLTIRDVYLKMLLCVRGITAEKAIEIQKRWKTPIEFIEAYKRCGEGVEGEKAKQNMVSNALVNCVGRKKIGKAVSVKIAEVWGNQEYMKEIAG